MFFKIINITVSMAKIIAAMCVDQNFAQEKTGFELRNLRNHQLSWLQINGADHRCRPIPFRHCNEKASILLRAGKMLPKLVL